MFGAHCKFALANFWNVVPQDTRSHHSSFSTRRDVGYFNAFLVVNEVGGSGDFNFCDGSSDTEDWYTFLSFQVNGDVTEKCTGLGIVGQSMAKCVFQDYL